MHIGESPKKLYQAAYSSDSVQQTVPFNNMGHLKSGVPEAALSNRETNFQSELMNQLYKLLDIQRLRTSAFHPQFVKRTLEQMLACYAADSQTEWDQYLPKLAFASYRCHQFNSVRF